MFGAWFIGRTALRTVQKHQAGKNPYVVQPYRGRRKGTYNTARFLITVIPLVVFGLFLITLCLGK